MNVNEMEAFLASVPADGRDRDIFIEVMEDAWGGLWLPLTGEAYRKLRPGCQIMQAAYDYAVEADPAGTVAWIEGGGESIEF